MRLRCCGNLTLKWSADLLAFEERKHLMESLVGTLGLKMRRATNAKDWPCETLGNLPLQCDDSWGAAKMQVGLLPSTFKEEEYSTKDKVRGVAKCCLSGLKYVPVFLFNVQNPGTCTSQARKLTNTSVAKSLPDA